MPFWMDQPNRVLVFGKAFRIRWKWIVLFIVLAIASVVDAKALLLSGSSPGHFGVC